MTKVKICTEMLYYDEDPWQYSKTVVFTLDETDFKKIKQGGTKWIFSKIRSMLFEDFLSECRNLNVEPNIDFFDAQFEDIQKEVIYAINTKISK